MMSSSKIRYLIILASLIFALTGCELPRDSSEAADLQPAAEELPPTLAPLGAEDSSLMAEATAVPTVINVQPTVTPSTLGAGEAAPDPGEPVAPTAQPPSLPVTPTMSSGQPAGASLSPENPAAPAADETSPPIAESAPPEPIIVDANEDLPEGGPIAANPPTSETMGDYAAPVSADPLAADITYTVQSGDTLFSLSQRYGTTVEAIIAVNGLPSDLVRVGQVLTIPADGGSYEPPAYGPAESGGETGNHIVAPGETLFSIAVRYNTTVEDIAGANNIPYPYIIYVGQPLIIPAYGTYPQAPPPIGYYPPNPGYPPQVPQDGYYPPQDDGYAGPDGPGIAGTHTVAPGETLYSIARGYGLTSEAIAAANGLANPNQIYVGQVLYLP